MNAIKVKKTNLIQALQKNREQHRKIFLEAQAGYRTELVKLLDAMLQAARDGKRVSFAVGLEEPMDQTRDYDRVIRMMEMSTEDVIDLTEVDFAMYVLDDWRWKRQFLQSNAKYSATAVREFASS